LIKACVARADYSDYVEWENYSVFRDQAQKMHFAGVRTLTRMNRNTFDKHVIGFLPVLFSSG